MPPCASGLGARIASAACPQNEEDHMRIPRDAAALVLVSTIAATGCGKSSSSGDDAPPATETPPPGGEVTPDAPGAGETPPDTEATDRPARGTTSTPDTNQPPLPPGPQPGSPEAECAAKWAKKSEIYKAGSVLTWEIVTKVDGAVANAGESTVRQQETVVSSDGETIQLERLRSQIAPAADEGTSETITWTKAEDVDFCVANATSDEQAETAVEVVDKRSEHITVRGGAFDTSYVKTHSANEDETFDAESWTLAGNDQIVVKTQSVWKTTINGHPYEQTTKWELTELRQAAP
jgi:hypothetical protein